MKKFKVGDWVYFFEGNMLGEIKTVNEDSTYDIEWEEWDNGGIMTVEEDDMVLGEKPDHRRIPEMNEKQFNETTTKTLQSMKEEYNITTGEEQIVVLFLKMFKDEYLKDYS